jgi:hypothetical protein
MPWSRNFKGSVDAVGGQSLSKLQHPDCGAISSALYARRTFVRIDYSNTREEHNEPA